MASPNKSTTSGFTLVEILIAMGIFTLVASLGLFMSMDFYRGSTFRSQSTLVISAIDRARSRSMNNINAAPHGVYVASTSYTLFQGSTYATRTVAYDESFTLSMDIVLTGIREVVFTQLTGESSAIGNIILTDGIRTATISFNNEGRINW